MYQHNTQDYTYTHTHSNSSSSPSDYDYNSTFFVSTLTPSKPINLANDPTAVKRRVFQYQLRSQLHDLKKRRRIKERRRELRWERLGDGWLWWWICQKKERVLALRI